MRSPTISISPPSRGRLTMTLARSLAGKVNRIMLVHCVAVSSAWVRKVFEIDRIIAGRGLLARLVVIGWRVGGRHRPVADHRHDDRLGIAAIACAAAAGEAEHRRIGIMIGRRNAIGIGELEIDVDRRRLDRAVRQPRAGRGLPRIDRLTGRRRVADQFGLIERGGADKGIGEIDGPIAGSRAVLRHAGCADQADAGDGQAKGSRPVPDR